MLALRPSREYCNRALPPEATLVAHAVFAGTIKAIPPVQR